MCFWKALVLKEKSSYCSLPQYQRIDLEFCETEPYWLQTGICSWKDNNSQPVALVYTVKGT